MDAIKRLPARTATLVLLLLLLLATTPALADEVVLQSGDVLHGRITSVTDDTVVLDHPELGVITIDRAGIVKITQLEKTAEEAEAEVEAEAEQAEQPPADEPAQEGPMPPETFEEASPEWSLSLNLGGAMTNNDEGEKVNLNVGLRVSRVKPLDEAHLRFTYLRKTEAREVTDDEATALLDQKWFVEDSPWLFYAMPRYDYDAFRSWEHRIQVHGGVGYKLLTTERFRLTGRLGGGVRKDFGSIQEPLRPEGMIGGSIEWRRTELTSLKISSYYYPALDTSDYRLMTNVDWSVKFARAANLSFVTSLEWEYATDPDEGFPPNNITWTWGLQYSF